MSDAEDRVQAAIDGLAQARTARAAADRAAVTTPPPDPEAEELFKLFTSRMPTSALLEVVRNEPTTRVEFYGPLRMRRRTRETSEPAVVGRAWLLARGRRLTITAERGWSVETYGNISLLVMQDVAPLFAVVPENLNVALLNPELPYDRKLPTGALHGASVRSAIFHGLELRQGDLPGATSYLHDYGNGISPIEQRSRVSDFPSSMLQWLTDAVAGVLYAQEHS